MCLPKKGQAPPATSTTFSPAASHLFLTSPFPHLTSPYLTSPYLASPHLPSPNLTSPLGPSRAHAFIKEQVTGFQPKAEDLAYPSKLEAAATAAAAAGGAEITEGEAAEGEAAEVCPSPHTSCHLRLGLRVDFWARRVQGTVQVPQTPACQFSLHAAPYTSQGKQHLELWPLCV